MAIDTQRLMDVILSLNLLWSSPLTIALSLYSLWGILGPSALAGLLYMVILIPVNAFISSKMKYYQKLNMKSKDNRMKAMNETLDGIKVLKLYAWEPYFAGQIADVRNNEVDNLKKMSYLGAVQTFIFNSTTFFVALFSFTAYVLVDSDNVLTAETAFVSISFFNIIRRPLNQLPLLVTQIISAAVSLDRLNDYLNASELDADNITHFDDHDDVVINISNGNLSWDKDKEPVLKNINLKVKKGELVAVVGQVGSGKSSLLSAMIGDLEKSTINAEVNMLGKVSYVPQQAWMQNASLQYNVTFGRNYDENLYDRVIQSCALRQDFDILPDGDQTEIGEKGINLSGGQKQRVSMARAVYNNGSIYLLDDPLSAVDSHVGKHIFTNVIGPTGLLKNKTRILVTHGVKFLPNVDRIVVMKDGQISESGTYRELLDHGKEFSEFLIQYLQEEEDQQDGGKDTTDLKTELEKKLGKDNLAEEIRKARSKSSKSNISGYTTGTIVKKIQPPVLKPAAAGKNFSTVFGKMVVDEANIKNKSLMDEKTRLNPAVTKSYGGKPGRGNNGRGRGDLMSKETLQTKAVEFEVYSFYFKAVGLMSVSVIFLLSVITQVLSIGTNVWLSAWSDDPRASETGVRNMYLSVYGVLGTLSALFIGTASAITAVGGLKASNKFHDHMLTNVLRAPTSFFDTTPKGRIVNRFAKDIDFVDRSIPLTFSAMLRLGFGVLGVIAVISYTSPIFLAVFAPLTVLYWFAQKLYVATSRQLKRLESNTRSPVYSWFGETITGVSTIKAFQMQEQFIKDLETKVDINQTCSEPSIISNRWISIRLEMLGNVIILFAALFAILGRDTLDPGIVGLSLSYAMQITFQLNMFIRQSSQIENNMVSVERIMEYQEGLPKEAEWILPNDPEEKWPSNGRVEIHNLTTR
jgi:ABC-type multidrug transport system fused ATPase/permease subunit